MTYLALNAVFLLVTVAVAVVAALTRSRRSAGATARTTVGASAMAVTVTLLLTAVFDNVMIAVGLFTYESDRIVGLMIGLAPIEDFFYPVAAAILLPAIWALASRRADPASGAEAGKVSGR